MEQTTEQIKKEFLDSMFLISHSIKTKTTYQSSLNHFKKFTQSQYNLDESEVVSKIKSQELDLYQVIRNFVIYLDQNGLKPQGLRSYLSGIKGFLRHSGIRINSDDFKQMVKIPRITKTREIPITKEMIIRILRNSSPKLQTAILICCSSGLRIGELVQLKLSDIDFTQTPTRLNLRGETAKGGMSRETFITSEATIALKDYLEKNFGWKEDSSNLNIQNTVIFGRISKNNRRYAPKDPVGASKITLEAGLKREIEKIPELAVRNENGRLAIHFHAFRKFFRTILGNAVGRDYAEALMGHSFYMDTYYQLPEKDKISKYLDAEPYLTIADFEKVEEKLTNLSEKYAELDAKFSEFKKYAFANSIEVPEHLR